MDYNKILADIKDRGWKVFLSSFLATFIMVTLQHLHADPMILVSKVCQAMPSTTCSQALINPQPMQIRVIDVVKPRLDNVPNNFFPKKPSAPISLVTQAKASSDFEGARAYVALDAETGDVILEKNFSQKTPIASLTKIMTAIVALDLASPKDIFTVTPNAANQPPTKLVLTPGEKISLEELLNASLLTSANDCTELIRDGVDAKYGSPVFIEAMNEKARFLGLKNSHFQNPQGFDNPNHYSSPEDLAILTKYALSNYPLIASIVQKDHAEFPATATHKEMYLNNWQGLLGVYPGVSGVKIGNTDDAGTTTVVTSTREGKKIIAVLLGAPGVLERDMWTAKLLDTAFATFAIKPVNVTESELRAKYKTWKYFN
jgi:D-alanyl-D-alanine carboxypeptidase